MLMQRLGICAAVLALGLGATATPGASASGTIDHSRWDQLLTRHVRHGLVDYEGLRTERKLLDVYLEQLETADVEALPSKEAELAFWINAYNANVVKGVLDHAPIASVKEVKGFFDRVRYRVAGRELTLNEIEGEGRALGDWRIHFAVVCASSSCPPLINEAYVPERLEAQLSEQTRQFLDNPQRGLRIEDGTLRVSRIFDWYTTDFVPAKELGLFRRLTPEKLLPRIEPYLDRDIAQAIRSRQPAIKFLDYDWSLNAQHR